MNGQYIYRAPEPHKCYPPLPGECPGPNPGDIWRCDCGQQWRLKNTWLGNWVWKRHNPLPPRFPGPGCIIISDREGAGEIKQP